MRHAVVGALFAGLACSWQASAAPSPATADPVVMPGTPSGAGDPDTIVCRAPQRMEDSGRFGPKACGRNYEWQRLAMDGKDLAPDGKTVIARPTVDNPTGDGDPDAVTCRTPIPIAGPDRIQRLGPEVCQSNRYWADVTKNHKRVDAYGRLVTSSPSMPWLLYGRTLGPGVSTNTPGMPPTHYPGL